MAQRLAILGSTGSIGTQSLKVIEQFRDRFIVCALGAGSNISLLEEQVRTFNPEIVAVYEEEQALKLKKNIADLNTKVLSGEDGMVEIAAWPSIDVVIVAVVGFCGVVPTLAAVKAGKKVALANKEALVVAGELIMKEARRHNAVIIPIDSEHTAIFQCLHAGRHSELKQVILTASGGPFLGKGREELLDVTAEQALKHPNWSMGPRITIDSATLMNKGLEVIEACHLFELEAAQVQVVIHPESIIHSMVEFVDGSIIAQMSFPDMRLPIQYALSYPQRWPNPFPHFNWQEKHILHFIPVDTGDYPCLDLAFKALQSGGTMPAVLNGADEVAVCCFQEGMIGFLQIPLFLAEVMSKHRVKQNPSLEDIVEADRWARETTRGLLRPQTGGK